MAHPVHNHKENMAETIHEFWLFSVFPMTQCLIVTDKILGTLKAHSIFIRKKSRTLSTIFFIYDYV
jgi:hypothetical protein